MILNPTRTPPSDASTLSAVHRHAADKRGAERATEASKTLQEVLSVLHNDALCSTG